MTAQELVNEILEYARGFRLDYSKWYAGITDNPDVRLFQEHNVNRDGYWVHTNYVPASNARVAETVLHNIYGFDGGPGGAESENLCVYAYCKTTSTRQ
jgi:hypothetical protein